MEVPFLDLKPQYEKMKTEIEAAIQPVLLTQQFILGPAVRDLEPAVAEYCGAKFGVGCASGSDALLLSLMALDVKQGDEVIVPAFTFFATAGAVHRLGARPVFADIDPVTFNLDPAALERAITPKTKAIIPVHLFGQCADMDGINAGAEAKGTPVIEDAAQAIGAKAKGRRAGGLATIGVLSFFPSKNLGAFGDGGMLTTNDAALAERLARLRVHGSRVKYVHEEVGFNSRLDTLQAAILLVKMRYLDQWHSGRRENAKYYTQRFTGTAVASPAEVAGNYHVFNQYTIRVKNRDEVFAHLKASGVGCDIYYPVPLHLQKCFEYLGYKVGDFPESEKAAAEVISLPIYPELPRAHQEYVAEKVLEKAR